MKHSLPRWRTVAKRCRSWERQANRKPDWMPRQSAVQLPGRQPCWRRLPNRHCRSNPGSVQTKTPPAAPGAGPVPLRKEPCFFPFRRQRRRSEKRGRLSRSRSRDRGLAWAPPAGRAVKIPRVRGSANPPGLPERLQYRRAITCRSPNRRHRTALRTAAQPEAEEQEAAEPGLEEPALAERARAILLRAARVQQESVRASEQQSAQQQAQREAARSC